MGSFACLDTLSKLCLGGGLSLASGLLLIWRERQLRAESPQTAAVTTAPPPP